MTDNTEIPNIPQAESVPEKRTTISVVWIIPILAAAVGIGIAVQQYLSEGPSIRIAFRSAEGVEAGKTSIKYKEIEIGKVTGVTLSKDYSRILVTAKMGKNTEGLLVNDASFWIVKPRVTLSGVSGISTLLSGNYIRFEPGTSKETGRDFVGLEVPPPATSGLPGREFVLRSDTLGSLGVGSPVYYRRLNVGQVISYALAKDGRSVDIRIFLNTPFDRFVTSNTQFWEASGIDLSVGAGGVSMRTESLLSLLVGGIAFETPASPAGNSAVADNAVFPLSRDQATALSPREADAERFALYFRGSLRGLSVGAPVDFLGLPIGEVTGVFLAYARGEESIRTRVEIVTYPFRLFEPRGKRDAIGGRRAPIRERRESIQRQVVGKGLRAQLRSASLISGQLYVAFDYFPDAPEAKIAWERKPPDFPVVPGEMASIPSMLRNLLAKLDKVPVEEIGNDARKAIATLDRALVRLEGETLPEARKTFAMLDRTLEHVDGEIVPEAKKALEELRRAIASTERVLADTDNTFLRPEAPGQQDLRDAMREIARAARAVRALADYLERNPSALIRGKTREKP
ncbi:MAG: mammalian cell entry protein [Deltaproteobacteria bacterium CG2_30_66_27]|nr:MAG: mammalian cell entry protein [Deltaproteobacteria bacterium CG2_30_66_27]